MNFFDDIQCDELNRDWIDDVIEDDSIGDPEDYTIDDSMLTY